MIDDYLRFFIPHYSTSQEEKHKTRRKEKISLEGKKEKIARTWIPKIAEYS